MFYHTDYMPNILGRVQYMEDANPCSTKVDLEGVEPSSKQGNHTLSTCLFRTSFSCGGKTRTTNRRLIP